MAECNVKCLNCGFIQEWHNNKLNCPKCGTRYNNRISGYDFTQEQNDKIR
jgi:Zn finger protein HypA/HybF involved in hydrogenase expression